MADNAVIEIMGKAPSVVKSKKSSKKESVETMLADILAAVKQINSKLYFINLPAQKGGGDGESNEDTWLPGLKNLFGPEDDAKQPASEEEEPVNEPEPVAQPTEPAVEPIVEPSEPVVETTAETKEPGVETTAEPSEPAVEQEAHFDESSSNEDSEAGDGGASSQYYEQEAETVPAQLGGAVKNEKKIQNLIAELQSLLCKAKTTSRKTSPPAFWTGTGHNMRTH